MIAIDSEELLAESKFIVTVITWEKFCGNRGSLFLGINTICGKNNQLSSHNWLVKFAEDTNQQFEIRTDKITSIRTGKNFW